MSFDPNDYEDLSSSTTATTAATTTTVTTTAHLWENVTYKSTTASFEERIAQENFEELIESSNCTLLQDKGHTFVFSEVDSTAAW